MCAFEAMDGNLYIYFIYLIYGYIKLNLFVSKS